MSNGKVIQIRQARPDAEEMKYFWKLYSAAQRVEDRWCTNTVPGIADALADTELSREEKLFLLRAWQVLVDDRGGFGRHLGALDTHGVSALSHSTVMEICKRIMFTFRIVRPKNNLLSTMRITCLIPINAVYISLKAMVQAPAESLMSIVLLLNVAM